MRALTAWNIKTVGVANNVAYDRANMLETLRVLDANGIAHTGGGKNIVEAHRPAIVERKGVKVGFPAYREVVPGCGADRHRDRTGRGQDQLPRRRDDRSGGR